MVDADKNSYQRNPQHPDAREFLIPIEIGDWADGLLQLQPDEQAAI
jgi:hypothetical protein